MSFIWSKNAALFRKRFPDLAARFPATMREEPPSFPDLRGALSLEEARDGSPTLKENRPEGSVMLHSKYNPRREAEALSASYDNSSAAALFLGLGLGYSPLAFARAHKDAPMILVEKDSDRFFFALSVLDWEEVFSHERLILLLSAPLDAVSDALSLYVYDKIQVFRSAPQTAYAKDYFDGIDDIIRKGRQTREVNQNTLEKFGLLWARNSLKNLPYLTELGGIARFENRARSLPFVVLAAGPSLERVLPYLKELRRRGCPRVREYRAPRGIARGSRKRLCDSFRPAVLLL